MMVGPPAAPAMSKTLPSGPVTMVGAIDESMRLPGATAFGSPCTRPNPLAVPGTAAKSSISLLSTKPAPLTVTPDPNHQLMVVVSATTSPCPSTTEKWVVCGPVPDAGPSTAIALDGVARSVAMPARCSFAHASESRRSTGSFTKSGSPSRALRAA